MLKMGLGLTLDTLACIFIFVVGGNITQQFEFLVVWAVRPCDQKLKMGVVWGQIMISLKITRVLVNGM